VTCLSRQSLWTVYSSHSECTRPFLCVDHHASAAAVAAADAGGVGGDVDNDDDDDDGDDGNSPPNDGLLRLATAFLAKHTSTKESASCFADLKGKQERFVSERTPPLLPAHDNCFYC
jgi:hypothetical protein